MKLTEFRRAAERLMRFVNHDQPLLFELLLEKSRQNERVRNVFGVYALADAAMFRRLVSRAVAKDSFAQDLLTNLEIALCSPFPADAKRVARELYAKRFNGIPASQVLSGSRSEVVAQELSKSFLNVFYDAARKVSPEQQQHVQKLIEDVRELPLSPPR